MKNYTDLTGKNAIVTGAAQGLSLGMAEGLMEAGAKVCIIDVNPKAEEVAKEKCAQGYDCHAVIANLTEEEDRKVKFSQAVEMLGGRLDILVNGAGVQRRHKSEEFPKEDWDFVMNVNLNAVFYMCQAALSSSWYRTARKDHQYRVHAVLLRWLYNCLPMRLQRALWLS